MSFFITKHNNKRRFLEMVNKRHLLKLLFALLIINASTSYLLAQEIQFNKGHIPIKIENPKRSISHIEMNLDLTKSIDTNTDFQKKLQPNSLLEIQKYNEYQSYIYPLTEQKQINLYGTNTHQILPGISLGNSATIGIILKPINRWEIDISSTALKYQDPLRNYYDIAFNASSHVFLSEKMGVHIYGGYSINGFKNVIKNYDAKSPFAPTSGYGTGIVYKFSDNFNIEFGFKNEYNYWVKRWEELGYVSGKIVF